MIADIYGCALCGIVFLRMVVTMAGTNHFFLYSIVLTTIDISNSCVVKPLAWKGDKTCDDDNNNAGCAWDGGDCCGANNYKHCKKCACRDCTFAAKSDACTKNIKGKCNLPDYVGDGVCDDEYVLFDIMLLYNTSVLKRRPHAS